MTAVTLAVPIANDRTQGVLTGIAGGVLTYMGATHLLPEAQSEHPSALTGIVFAATLIAMTAITLLGLALSRAGEPEPPTMRCQQEE
jgi:zinc transporter ZupT